MYGVVWERDVILVSVSRVIYAGLVYICRKEHDTDTEEATFMSAIELGNKESVGGRV